jgi:hypothetical protein
MTTGDTRFDLALTLAIYLDEGFVMGGLVDYN